MLFPPLVVVRMALLYLNSAAFLRIPQGIQLLQIPRSRVCVTTHARHHAQMQSMIFGGVGLCSIGNPFTHAIFLRSSILTRNMHVQLDCPRLTTA